MALTGNEIKASPAEDHAVIDIRDGTSAAAEEAVIMTNIGNEVPPRRRGCLSYIFPPRRRQCLPYACSRYVPFCVAEQAMIGGDFRGRITIPIVPGRLRQGEEGEHGAYAPRIISFGPYHRGQHRLKDMEKHKQRYLDAILSRSQSSRPVLESRLMEKHKQRYLDAVLSPSLSSQGDLLADVRSCYSEDIGYYGEDQFFEMMILDGCFIVEYLLRFREGAEDELNKMIWVRPLLFYDILLLENQLPFFLLDYIFDHVQQHCQNLTHLTFMDLCIHYFKHMLIHYFNPMFRENISLQPPPPEPLHLLHLCHSFLTNSTIADDIAANTGEEEPIMIPSAKDLRLMGIILKVNKAKKSIIDIKFNKATGVLEIPHLVIDDFTNSLFRNLIAFEQFYPISNGKFLSHFSAYVQFMDYIVNTPEDVALLYKKDIVKHFLGCDEDVAHLFNKLNRGNFIDPHHYLLELYKEVNSYRNFLWPRWRTNLMHNYFNTPWASISVAAAVFLLILSFLQTVFTGISTF